MSEIDYDAPSQRWAKMDTINVDRIRVIDLIHILSKFPADFHLEFSPGEVQDVTPRAAVETLEGSTAENAGTVWIRLKD